ncbi:MAG: PQQ-dependent sugar dehydrogenase [Saprospiraceae bacterium]|nr:PQQ-dependent sugar dehydrogenase [Candidatus Vicinibacter proximus]MBL7823800.1 PQQ-dependent sugar dehydrogenase [Saprospiraceae bacterium]MCC6844447.1 PQQ-dependent sugar dehydrogenase [Saprospiraceae bacterium]
MWRVLVVWMILVFPLVSIFSQNAIKLTKLTGGLSIPVYLCHAGDDRLFVIEKAGKIRILNNGIVSPVPFLDIVNKVNSRGNEQGLLGLAFHPDFKNNGLFYVNYNNKISVGQTVIAEYKVFSNNPNKADSLSERILLTIDQPYSNHNGGCMHFGKDGYLYIGMGDGGNGGDPQNHGQNPKSLLGKMLRIEIGTSSTYQIPPSNPFVNDPDVLDEIWAIGVRNPWRFSFDRLTGDMWIGDVGQGNWEEVDFEESGSGGGRNYGWRCYEGNKDFNTTGCSPKNKFTFPIHEYFSDENNLGCSVTGGYVYRGSKHPSLYGTYIYGDYCSGYIWGINQKADKTFENKTLYKFNRSQISSFGEDVNGELYLIAIAEGAVYKIADTCNLPAIQFLTKNPLCPTSTDGQITISNPNPTYTYKWSTGDSSAVLEGLGPGKFSLTITSGICSIEGAVELKSPIPDTACITPVFVNEICENDSAILIACDALNAASYIWEKDSVVIRDKLSKRIYVNASGKYSVQFVDTNGCISFHSGEIEIIVHPSPDKPIIIQSGDTLFAPSGYNAYRWFLNEQLLGGSTVNQWVITQKGSYRVSVIDSNNCESLSSEPLYIIPLGVVNNFEKPIGVFSSGEKNHFVCLVNSDLEFPLNYQILDAQGKPVRQKVNLLEKTQQFNFELTKEPSGIYFLKVQDRFGKIIGSVRVFKN